MFLFKEKRIAAWHSKLNVEQRQNEGLIGVTFVSTNQHTANLYLFNPNVKQIELENENDTEIIYVILPYFNFVKSNRRRQLLLEFVERYKRLDNIRLVLAEAVVLGQLFDLPNKIDGIYAHHRFTLKHQIWCKENLINVVAKNKLPSDWKYLAWIDPDLTFQNKNWPQEAIYKLRNENTHFIQLFETVMEMNSFHTFSFNNASSFGFKHQQSPQEWYWEKFDRHVGLAWACKREAFDAMNGLFELGIIGSGDYYMALSMANKVDAYFEKMIKASYKNVNKEFYFKIKEFELKWISNRFKFSYINGNVEHHWHGDLRDRQYNTRRWILSKHRYNPMKDLIRDDQGLMELSKVGERIHQDLKKYFLSRNEV